MKKFAASTIFQDKDSDIWDKNEKLRFIYNKLYLCSIQKIPHAIFPIVPKSYPVVIKPIANLYEISSGAKKIDDSEDFADYHGYLGMWMQFIEGEHYQYNILIKNGKLVYVMKWVCSQRSSFNDKRWHTTDPILPEFIHAYITRQFDDYTGCLTINTIGDTMIEISAKLGMMKYVLNLNNEFREAIELIKKTHLRNMTYPIIYIFNIWLAFKYDPNDVEKIVNKEDMAALSQSTTTSVIYDIHNLNSMRSKNKIVSFITMDEKLGEDISQRVKKRLKKLKKEYEEMSGVTTNDSSENTKPLKVIDNEEQTHSQDSLNLSAKEKRKYLRKLRKESGSNLALIDINNLNFIPDNKSTQEAEHSWKDVEIINQEVTTTEEKLTNNVNNTQKRNNGKLSRRKLTVELFPHTKAIESEIPCKQKIINNRDTNLEIDDNITAELSLSSKTNSPVGTPERNHNVKYSNILNNSVVSSSDLSIKTNSENTVIIHSNNSDIFERDAELKIKSLNIHPQTLQSLNSTDVLPLVTKMGSSFDVNNDMKSMIMENSDSGSDRTSIKINLSSPLNTVKRFLKLKNVRKNSSTRGMVSSAIVLPQDHEYPGNKRASLK